jgi:thioredoxin-related protein
MGAPSAKNGSRVSSVTLRLALLMTVSLCLLAIGRAQAAEDTRDPRQFFFAQSFGDLPDEIDEARQAGKLGLLLFFEQEGCPFCEYMMKNVLNQPAVQDWYRERFMSITVDLYGDIELRDVDGITLPSKVFAAHRRVRTTPTLSFIDLNGTEVYRHSRMVRTPEDFLLMGQYVADGHYTDTIWKDYAARQAASSNVPHVLSFRDEGLAAAANGVILLLAVTRDGCPYCARLRRDVLLPMIRSGDYSDRVVIREMMMEPDAPVVDFTGRTSSTAQMATEYEVTITPTVLLLDGSGRSLHPPITGINNAEMYGYYLDQAIESAAAALAAGQAAAQE